MDPPPRDIGGDLAVQAARRRTEWRNAGRVSPST